MKVVARLTNLVAQKLNFVARVLNLVAQKLNFVARALSDVAQKLNFVARVLSDVAQRLNFVAHLPSQTQYLLFIKLSFPNLHIRVLVYLFSSQLLKEHSFFDILFRLVSLI